MPPTVPAPLSLVHLHTLLTPSDRDDDDPDLQELAAEALFQGGLLNRRDFRGETTGPTVLFTFSGPLIAAAGWIALSKITNGRRPAFDLVSDGDRGIRVGFGGEMLLAPAAELEAA